MYRVIKEFADLTDYKKIKEGKIYYEYSVGDTYPRQGKKVDEKRIKELLGAENARGEPLIEAVQEGDAQ